MYTIRVLAKQFNLSRSTLLYYDSIGLLSPSKRSETNYRLYSEKDKEKLEKICMYSEMGIPLKEIKKLLKLSGKSAFNILENQVTLLGKKITSLRKQQYSIMEILQNEKVMKKAGIIDKDNWKEVLRLTGLDDEGMDRWHAEFERNSPEAHKNFLIALGIPEDDISLIRKDANNY